MADIVTIGGKTKFAGAVCIVELNGSGFPIDPSTGLASADNTVSIGGKRQTVQAVALYVLSAGEPIPYVP